MSNDIIVGIDLGTTNSEIAAYINGRPQIISYQNQTMLPSCVGISSQGKLLVGHEAKNQLLLYPEMTIHSIKRKMGTEEKIKLADKTFTPPEISALILRELAEWAAQALKQPVSKAVITVPAFFSDAQRQATREAGHLAGLEVVRILNEPTAASLAYHLEDDSAKTIMVYDLGGGTFDVSLVTIEKDVTEVLASHGNNHLGGNDFDEMLLQRLLDEFKQLHGIDLRDCHPIAHSRLRWAAEKAKQTLSNEPYVHIREESLIMDKATPLHLDLEISRRDYEEMITPKIEETLASVSKVMADADKRPDEIDEILLVGGSSRTPLVRQMLEDILGLNPRQDIHPDLCVALGAGVMASRLAGCNIDKLLVDVSPYSYGPSHLGLKDGRPYAFCYRPIIKRNTALPITRTESYVTAAPYQEKVEINIFQGDDPDAMKNILVGNFMVEGLTPTKEANEVLCRMNLDLDGILKVTAIEKRTSKSQYITIRNASEPKTNEQLKTIQAKLSELFSGRLEEFDETFSSYDPIEDASEIIELEADATDSIDGEADPEDEQTQQARRILSRSRELLDQVHDEDKEELIDLNETVSEAINRNDKQALATAMEQLKELLFFIEGK